MATKEELMAEKERVEADLAKHAHKDPKIKDNYVADFTNMGDDEDSNAAEVAQHEVDLAIVNALEKRLQEINEQLATM